MALRDYLPWNRLKFASVGSNPPFAANEPRDFGAVVIKRIQLQKNGGMFGSAYEKQIGDARTYMIVYLADPIVKTLIDLPCLYAAKDGYDIVTDHDEERQVITKLFDEINIDQLLYGWVSNGRIFGTGYVEFTGDNLILSSSLNMNVKRAANGQIMHYYND